MRSGRRAGSRLLVVHLRAPAHTEGMSTEAPRVGLVVSKAVGNAVVRNRVKRRLRHQVSSLLGALPPGSTLVLRALPPAATASSTELSEELATGVERCLRRTHELTGLRS